MSNNKDNEKAKEIAINSKYQSNSNYDERSVEYGAGVMAKYKNEEFKQLLRNHSDEFHIELDKKDKNTVWIHVEDFINNYLN